MGEARRRGTREQRRAIAILTDRAERQESVLQGLRDMLGYEVGSRCWLQIYYVAARARKFYASEWFTVAVRDRRRLVGITLLAEGALKREVRG